MSEDDINHLSCLDKNQESSFDCKSLESNSFIMNFITDFDEEYLNDLKSASSLQLSKSSISQINDRNTVIINKTKQIYGFAVENQMKTISDLSFNESLNKEYRPEPWRMSEAVTSAKNSFIEDLKGKEAKYCISNTSFALPNKMYCSNCQCEVTTVVTFQVLKPSIWSSVEAFFQSIKCCDTKVTNQIKELIHTCRKCNKILARVLTD